MNKEEYFNTLKIQHLIMFSHLKNIFNKVSLKEKVSKEMIKEVELFINSENEFLKINK